MRKFVIHYTYIFWLFSKLNERGKNYNWSHTELHIMLSLYKNDVSAWNITFRSFSKYVGRKETGTILIGRKLNLAFACDIIYLRNIRKLCVIHIYCHGRVKDG
jgi:hypothetical protein